jgi:hypothetical protein
MMLHEIARSANGYLSALFVVRLASMYERSDNSMDTHWMPENRVFCAFCGTGEVKAVHNPAALLG